MNQNLARMILGSPVILASDLRWQAHLGQGERRSELEARGTLQEAREAARSAAGVSTRLQALRRAARAAGALARARGALLGNTRRARSTRLPSVAAQTRTGR